MTLRPINFDNSRAQRGGWSLCSDSLIRRLSLIFDNMQAFEEGWGIFDDGLIHCNITDASLEGQTTADVRHFVERRANEGSHYHRRAWEIHCTTIANQRLGT